MSSHEMSSGRAVMSGPPPLVGTYGVPGSKEQSTPSAPYRGCERSSRCRSSHVEACSVFSPRRDDDDTDGPRQRPLARRVLWLPSYRKLKAGRSPFFSLFVSAATANGTAVAQNLLPSAAVQG